MVFLTEAESDPSTRTGNAEQEQTTEASTSKPRERPHSANVPSFLLRTWKDTRLAVVKTSRSEQQPSAQASIDTVNNSAAKAKEGVEVDRTKKFILQKDAPPPDRTTYTLEISGVGVLLDKNPKKRFSQTYLPSDLPESLRPATLKCTLEEFIAGEDEADLVATVKLVWGAATLQQCQMMAREHTGQLGTTSPLSQPPLRPPSVPLLQGVDASAAPSICTSSLGPPSAPSSSRELRKSLKGLPPRCVFRSQSTSQFPLRRISKLLYPFSGREEGLQPHIFPEAYSRGKVCE